ncbi:hypothetical protein [Caballeronia sp. M1242]|uniref:hypothetical protein n=1 Tax=Caballeronia sp. M1242 TaxID=2814653 RepID=UPI0019D2A333|nr:hypothetical protein [Caballeronia sp. M1242]QSN64077.1 hypothetical protein JYK05_22455 [Caballeronia sp. M1242]
MRLPSMNERWRYFTAGMYRENVAIRALCIAMYLRRAAIHDDAIRFNAGHSADTSARCNTG